MTDERGDVTLEELRAIEDRFKAATQGPWKSYVEGRDHLSGSDFIMTGGEDIELTGATIADQDFIAEARQDLPRLVTEIRRLRSRLTELQDLLDTSG